MGISSFPAKKTIKSIQRGTISWSDSTDSNITISSVDTSKSFVNLIGGYSQTGSGGAKVIITLGLTSSTNLNFKSQGTHTQTSSADINWEVIEYA